MNATQRALHQARCFDEFCGYCTNRAEAARDAADEPLTPGEEQAAQNAYEKALDDNYERRYGRDWT